MKDRVQLPSALVSAALAHARAAGLDPTAIAAERGIAAVDGDELPVVTARQTRELLDAVATALGDPLLGVHLAANMERGLYGVLEYAVRSAPDIRGALERLTKYIALVSAPAAADLVTTEGVGGATLRFRFPGIRGTLGRHGNEFFAATVWQRGRELTGVPFRLTRLAFEHSAPESRKALEDFFETRDVTYEAAFNELHLDDVALALPIVSHDPKLLPLLDKMAADQFASRTTGLADTVANAIRASLDQGEPSLEAIARTLGTSGRTLQRRLTEEEAPFAEVVDTVRSELARLYVRDAERSLDDVARLLGYAGPRPFQRAFKRWTGMTPLEYRKT